VLLILREDRQAGTQQLKWPLQTEGPRVAVHAARFEAVLKKASRKIAPESKK
jgi:hypothetical protein